MQRPLPSRDKIDVDTPLRLSVAAALAFPDGSMTASGLRREAGRGRLVVERIAGKDYTTLANIERMRQLCRVERKAPTSGFAQIDVTPPDGSSAGQPGPSSTTASSSAQDALRAKLKLRNASSPNTSAPSTDRPEKSATSN
jgi:hypothetical protein